MVTKMTRDTKKPRREDRRLINSKLRKIKERTSKEPTVLLKPLIVKKKGKLTKKERRKRLTKRESQDKRLSINNLENSKRNWKRKIRRELR